MSDKGKRSPATSSGQASPGAPAVKAVKTTHSNSFSLSPNIAPAYSEVIDLTQSDDEGDATRALTSNTPLSNPQLTTSKSARLLKGTTTSPSRSENDQVFPSTTSKASQPTPLATTSLSALRSSPPTNAPTITHSACASWKATLRVGSLVLAPADRFQGLCYGKITLIGPPSEYDSGILEFCTKTPYRVEFFHPVNAWHVTQRFDADSLNEPYILSPPPTGLTFKERMTYIEDAHEFQINDIVLAKVGKGVSATYHLAKMISEQKQKGNVLSYGIELLASKQKKTKLKRRHLVPTFGDSSTVLNVDKAAIYPHQPVLKGQQGPMPVSEIIRVKRFKTWLNDAAGGYFSVEEDSENEDDEGGDEEEGEVSGGEQERDDDEGAEEELRDPEEHELCYYCGDPLDLNNPTEVATRDCGECE